MANVTVDVDIDEFDLCEILEGVNAKWNNPYSRNINQHKETIREFFKDLINEGVGTPTRRTGSLIDELKMSAVMDGLDSKSLAELQEFFKT